jgi:hypothetical protein
MANFDTYIPLLLKVEAKLPPRPEGKSPEWLYDYATTYGWTVDSGGPTMCDRRPHAVPARECPRQNAES